MSTSPKIFCALDTGDLEQAKRLAREVGPVTGGLKLGLEFFNRHGPQGIEAVMNETPNTQIFVDLKYYDIPNTVAGAIRSICSNLAPVYLNVHALGGTEMMQKAVEACGDQTKLLGVTILTSYDQAGLEELGFTLMMREQVGRLALLTRDNGLAGVVCSGEEIEHLRGLCGDDFTLMVPGIRPAGADQDDQKRVMTPIEALDKGATHLVIGRPITEAPDPAKAAEEILGSLS